MQHQRLDHLAHLVATGADARGFLDGQLTRNVPAQGGPASLAGYCSPKGRLLALFTVWADDTAIHLVTTRDVAPAVVRRLRMYVLRAKVALDDATGSHPLVGLVDDGAPVEDAWRVRRDGDATTVELPPADGRARRLVIDPTASGVDGATWRWSEIRAGLPSIVGATQERFVPQMVNLEAIGGVDFRKGCFPGQEIVARSQYLGKLKRRVALARALAEGPLPRPGDDAWIEGVAEPQGTVVDAAVGPDGIASALVELPVALGAAPLRLASADGPTFAIETLPYALPDNEVFARPKL